MKMRRMGRTGLKVSEICLGTMTFGHQCDERDVVSPSWTGRPSSGVNFIDTADVYPVPPQPETAGRTEEIVGTLAARASATSSCWRPSAGCASATGPTTRACRAGTS